ncbi:hypothetical protein IAQ61_004023 [Plenodomus lingam]|uniref:DUF3752 domain-containing protein n=1 Tax=Leptosphaeria maculans (strain JN3 / isolate v23.1.3 / race Av1-4-5-6-7-8) TaxID=985895 RepID=E4ZWY4_LEPMJ|nr:hypothetical protein LEMA_P023460.1 [Plenodomus lingam JN3]KAH9873400.1 hypothetical protein IAQ61_004023 [Plenodomus lingam]CBX95194.1 hypothetical protein LEMA_P023460.1 [Plenodomus lingam JN3]
MPVGPRLPPHLTKRGRDDDDDVERASSPESGDKRRRVQGPVSPPSAPPSCGTLGPSLPPSLESHASDSNNSHSNVGPAHPQPSEPARIVGPAPPPAPLDQRPAHVAENDDSDSSEDEFGPAPPPPDGAYISRGNRSSPAAQSAFDTDPRFSEAPKRAQRDEWMTLPPTQDDLAARMDPTKMRARKFNSTKGAAGSGAMSSAWTETPEQKLKRLQNEALGIAAPSNAPVGNVKSKHSEEEERRARKMKEKIDAARGKSLVEQHQEKGEGKEKEDDPSKRAFDYEKDMAVSGTVSHKQRREMLNKSKGFSDRFSSGSFL